MIYKEYGKTGKKVSVIGFGGMRFKEDHSIEEAATVVRRANELGINYFDTAPTYCNEKSEIIFGEAFRDMPGRFYVSTKSTVKKDPTADDVRRRLETSLRRMGLEKIDFYHMWCIIDLDQYRAVMAPGGPYEGAMKAKEEGLIEHIVFSTHCSGRDIAKIVEDGYFEGVTLGYNAVNFPYREEGLKAAYEYGLGVVTMNPLGGGLIPSNREYFSFLRKDEGESTVQAALRFNASHKEITVVLAGMGTVEEVEEDVKAVEYIKPIIEEEVSQIKSHISMGMNELCTECGYCNSCPQGIYIPGYMEAYNYGIIKGEEAARERLKWAKEWISSLKNSPLASKCVECGQCEELCTQRLPIIQRLAEISEKYEITGER